MNIILKKIFPYILVLISISGINDTLPFNLPLGVLWAINSLVFLSIIYIYKKYIHINIPILINIYIIWNIVCIIHGCFVAEIYWDWKALISTGFGLLMPILCYIFILPDTSCLLFKKLVKSSFFIFPLLLFFSLYIDRPGRYLTFFYLFMICITILPTKWKILTILVLLYSCLYSFDARSNIIRAVVASAIGLLYYLRNYIGFYLKLIQQVVLFAPFIFLLLALSNTFNIFNMSDYLGDSTITETKNGETVETNLVADTRTFLYAEVITSAINNNHVIFGRSPARGYESQYFSLDTRENRNINIRIGERHGTEVSILNIFLHTGLLGVILYFSVFYYSSYLSIFKSKNIFIKLIGLFIIFRWCYAWVEDFNQFDINYAILWMFISMCISPYYRNMSNTEFKQWLLSIIKK